MNFEIKVDTSGIDRMLADIPAAVERAKTQALKDIGADVVSRTQMAFRHPQVRPEPWEPRKPTYIVKVNKKTGEKTKKLDDHPLLIKSGALHQSIFWFKIHGDDRVTIMSDKNYAWYHQTGTKNMPARPFFPVKDGELVPQIQNKIEKRINEAIDKELPKGSIPRPIWPEAH